MFGVMMASFVQSTEENLALICPPVENANVIDDSSFGCGPKNAEVAVNMLLAEIVATFVLCGVILSQKAKENDAPGTLKAFAVGLTLTGAEYAVNGISGGCLNPAVGLVQLIFQKQMMTSKTVDGIS